jgi:hypothetical protein
MSILFYDNSQSIYAYRTRRRQHKPRGAGRRATSVCRVVFRAMGIIRVVSQFLVPLWCFPRALGPGVIYLDGVWVSGLLLRRILSTWDPPLPSSSIGRARGSNSTRLELLLPRVCGGPRIPTANLVSASTPNTTTGRQYTRTRTFFSVSRAHSDSSSHRYILASGLGPAALLIYFIR